jgi:glycosyltransferase involved in cell wall biosynthesis/predicted O-methyltransferase YrrM
VSGRRPASAASPTGDIVSCTEAVPTMPENPLISVVLLCYNHEKFVAEAVDGVLAQTYSPLEIVVIDDASTDSTASVIAERLARNRNPSNVTFVRNPRNMVSDVAARLGIEMTKGSLILVSSGDDVMLPDMIAEMAKVWMANKVSLVTTNAIYIDEHSNPLGRTHRDPAVRADDSFETLARDGANACCFGPAIGFEREIYTTFGWPARYLNAYDIMVPFYAYLLKGACYIEKPLLKYRVHSQNTSLSLIAERTSEIERLLTMERMFFGHVAHGFRMQEEMTRLSEQAPDRYREIAHRIHPLLTVQITEMARKLVATRIKLYEMDSSPRVGHFFKPRLGATIDGDAPTMYAILARIPVIGRPFEQLERMRRERDDAILQRDLLIKERAADRNTPAPRVGDRSVPLSPELAADIEDWYRGKEFGYDWTSVHFPGWTAVLASLRDRIVRILEIGSYEGRSAIFFLNYFPRSTIVCVDPWDPATMEPDLVKLDPAAEAEYLKAQKQFDRNLAPFTSRVTKIVGKSSDVLPDFGVKGELFDLVYVDGEHKSVAAYRDCMLAWPLLKPGGILIIDDYEFDLGLPEAKRPKQGVDAFLLGIGNQYEELHRAYQLIVRRRA